MADESFQYINKSEVGTLRIGANGVLSDTFFVKIDHHSGQWGVFSSHKFDYMTKMET